MSLTRNISIYDFRKGEIKMLASTIPTHNIRYKFGWIALLLAATLMALMHFSLIFILDEPVLFTGFAVFNLYALIVILIPFRRGEKWSWMTTWLLPIGLALPAALDPVTLFFYFAVAAVCVLGLLLTRQDFFSKK
jgi:hypothetical protein